MLAQDVTQAICQNDETKTGEEQASVGDVELVIDEGFKRQLVPLTPVERGMLEESLIRDGCYDNLKVWGDGGDLILIDGHNRYELCKENDIAFNYDKMSFSSRSEVEEWIDRNQAARRNITPDDYKILTGRIYNRRKKAHGRPAGSSEEKRGQLGPLKTAESVASEFNTSPKTIKRNGQRAELHDTFRAAGDDDAAEAAKHVPQSVIQTARRERVEAAKERVKVAHVKHNSGENEWYTPQEFIDAARAVMKQIDLDPASSKIANKRVKAKRFFSKDNDGLKKRWAGNVWMNPPYAQPLITEFSTKLATAFGGDVSQAIVLVNNATETQWFRTLADKATAVCFPQGRIRFLDPDGNPGAPLQGQAVLYMGASVEAFAKAFCGFGACWLKGVNSGKDLPQ